MSMKYIEQIRQILSKKNIDEGRHAKIQDGINRGS